MKLEGCVALVTGSARRVGRAIAERLAATGCHVAVHYRRSSAEAGEVVATCRKLGVEAESFAADLAESGVAAELVRRVLERFGRLDVLVNNASQFDRMTLDDFDEAAWQHTMSTNVTAPIALVHAAREALRSAGGRVINLCDAATDRPWPDHLAYIASKAALETLTKALARALAPEINVVGIAPGVVDWPEEYDDATRQRLTRRIPLQRAGSPNDVAAAVEFLVRDGDYITGEILRIDGGRRAV